MRLPDHRVAFKFPYFRPVKTKEIALRYSVFEGLADLSANDQALFNRAVEAMKSAYAPYSKFNVGASLRLIDGTVVIGSNQENIAYPSGLCAERVALFSASANRPSVQITALAVVASPITIGHDLSVTPCGGCRQVMAEYERLQAAPIRILTGTPTGAITVIENAGSLLPLAFFDAGLANRKPQ